MEPWKTRLHAELSRAEAARLRGNEGQARVCARRAAGIAIREHAARHGRAAASASVMDLFEELRRDPSTPASLHAIIGHLSQPVDTSFKLPPGVDLLEEARSLCDVLLPGWRDTD